MKRASKVIGFSVPRAMVKEVENLARVERRTKSELFREMVRVYQHFRKQRDLDEARWIANLVRETEREQALRPMPTHEMLANSQRLARAAAKRAKKLGIKISSRSVNNLIHERRKVGRPA
jgi:hypothetical protein